MRFLVFAMLIGCSGQNLAVAADDDSAAATTDVLVGCQLHWLGEEPDAALGSVCDKALTMDGRAYEKTALGWSEPMQMTVKGEKGDKGEAGPVGPAGTASLPQKYIEALELISSPDPYCCRAGNGPETMVMPLGQFSKFHLTKRGHGSDTFGECE